MHRRAVLAALPTLAGSGCAFFSQPTPVPMELITDDNACTGTQAPVLLVLLPGAFMSPAEMAHEGMLRAVRSRGLAVDVLAVGATLEYVYDRSVFDRLDADVIGPYSARGYRRIWLAGISLGGYLALAYAMTRPGTIEGILALAPYLGKRELVQAVAEAPSPKAWAAAAAAPAAGTPPIDVLEDRLWRWLVNPPAGAPQLHLGFGSEDRFAPAHRVLAGILPPERVLQAPGGHDWPPWLQLWGQWLDRSPLPRACVA